MPEIIQIMLTSRITVICGLSIGYEDKAAAANRLRTDRVPVSEFARFIGFE